MREPASPGIFGLMAEFDRPERLVAAAKAAREADFHQLDAYSPFPIEQLTELLELHDRRIPLLTLIGGVAGAALGYGLQVYTNLAFPIDIGNRPLAAMPAFMLITFELGVLFAVLTAIAGMLVLNRLPKLHHPVFDVPTFDLVSMDKFFLIIFSNDRRFDPESTRDFLMGLKPHRVDLLTYPVAES